MHYSISRKVVNKSLIFVTILKVISVIHLVISERHQDIKDIELKDLFYSVITLIVI